MEHELLVPHVTVGISIEYFAGLIDGEGSFLPHYVKAEEKWYPQAYFTITLRDKPEWRQIVNYGLSTYGGIWYRYEEVFITWRITRTEELLPFLDRVIPYLIIKKAEAEKMRRFLIAYPAYKDKGKKTKEEAITLFEQLSA